MALAVMAFVSLVVVALLSLVLATLLANRNVGIANRYTRAADAALESAVDNIRMDATGNLGTRLVADPAHCDAGGGNYNFANGTRPADAVAVAVTCTVDTNFAATRVPAAAYSAKQGSLLVVGDSYNGGVKWKTDCPTTGAGSLGPNCFPWTSALGIAHYAQATSAIGAYPATLVHSGPAALSFASNLVVKKGTVAVRNAVQGSPSLLVGGTYSQGSPGLMASSVTCGLLAKEHAWSVAATRLADLSNTKVCDDPTAKALTADDGLNAPTAPWTPTVIRSKATTAPASCAGSTVALEPGAYNQVETARLNTLFDGTCASKTFWFKPGDYWFDAGGSDSALSIKDATSNFVFGAMASTGSVCDPAQSGVSITLSARSSIRHTGGNVSVCPKLSGSTASTAIYQNGQADNGWIASATAMTATASGTQVSLSGVRSPSTATVTNPSSALVTDGNSAGASFTCDEPSKALVASDFFAALAAGHNCGGSAVMTFTGWGDTGGPAPSSIPITSAQVVVTGAARHANADFGGTPDGSSPALVPSQTVIDVTPQGSTRTCSVTYPQINRSGDINSVSYELLDDAHTTPGRPGQPSCSSLLTDRVSLYKANIVITQHVNADCPFVILDPLTGLPKIFGGSDLDSIYSAYDCGGSYGFTIDSAQVRTSSVVQSTAFTPTPDYDASNPGYWFSGYQYCPFTGGCPAIVKNITVNNFDNSTAPYVPTGSKMASATALINGSSNNANGAGSKLDLTLTIPGYPSCTTSAKGLPGARLGRGYGDVSQTDSIDLFASPSTCGALLSTVDAALLNTASLKVTTTLACESLCLPTREFDFVLNRVQISTTSVDPYSRPVSASLFTEKSAATQFVVAGGISMPRATLDLAWRGTAPDPATSPILGGRSVIGALGSDMSPTASIGVVCCTPSVSADRLVRLDARVNGKVRASAVVHFVDTSSGASMPGKLVEVRDWHYCTDQRCSDG